jgi:hypothetical protein
MPRPKPRSSDRLSLKQIPVRGMGSTSLNGSKTHSVPLSTHAAAHHLHAAQHAGLSRLGRRFR